LNSACHDVSDILAFRHTTRLGPARLVTDRIPLTIWVQGAGPANRQHGIPSGRLRSEPFRSPQGCGEDRRPGVVCGRGFWRRMRGNVYGSGWPANPSAGPDWSTLLATTVLEQSWMSFRISRLDGETLSKRRTATTSTQVMRARLPALAEQRYFARAKILVL